MTRKNLMTGPQIILGGLSIATGILAFALFGLFIAYNAPDFIMAIVDAVIAVQEATK